MNETDIQLFGKLVSELRDLDQRRTEIFSEFLTEIGKPFTETPTKTEKPTLDEIGSLRYVDKTSDKGPYKTASLTDNPNNPTFLKLQKYLKDHNNFAVLHGYKIWNFQNSDTIGRRKQ